MLFDTHAHLYEKAFHADREEIIAQIADRQMSVLLCASDIPSSYEAVALAEKHPFFYAAAGVHPHEAKTWNEESEDILRELVKREKTVAIGEIGLDFHYDYSPRPVQRDVFARQILLAGDLDVPFVIHSRQASQETYDILKAVADKKQTAILHSFSQSTEMLKEYAGLCDMYFSISGPVTFKNASSLRQTVRHIPKERLLAETDSPYLTPVPFRGRRNTPLMVEYVVKELAELFSMSEEEMETLTAGNAKRAFRIP